MPYGPLAETPALPEGPFSLPYAACDLGAGASAEHSRHRGLGFLVLDFCLGSGAGTLALLVPGLFLLPRGRSGGLDPLALVRLLGAVVAVNAFNAPAVLAGAYVVRLCRGGPVVVRRRWMTALAGALSPFLSLFVFLLCAYLPILYVFRWPALRVALMVLAAAVPPTALGCALVKPRRDDRHQ